MCPVAKARIGMATCGDSKTQPLYVYRKTLGIPIYVRDVYGWGLRKVEVQRRSLFDHGLR